MTSTLHGPVIKQQDGAPVAMKVAALDSPFRLEEYWQMATARTLQQFEKAVSRLEVPCFNILCADRDGHIEQQSVRAKVLLTYGNCSKPGSPHRTDQLPPG